MITNFQNKSTINQPIPIPCLRHWTKRNLMRGILLLDMVLVIILVLLLSGCSSMPAPVLPAHFETDTHGLQIIESKRSERSERQIQIGMALVTSSEASKFPYDMTQETWAQFAARIKREVQGRIPVSMQQFIHFDGKQPLKGEVFSTGFNGLRQQSPVNVVLVVIPSSLEVRGPAKFDLLPEVSMLNGYQIENHATVELGLLDLESGKLLAYSQGASFATLEQLDTPLESNRYPRVRGSDLVNPIYPEKSKALETLRVLALNEALDQAVLKLSSQWTKG